MADVHLMVSNRVCMGRDSLHKRHVVVVVQTLFMQAGVIKSSGSVNRQV